MKRIVALILLVCAVLPFNGVLAEEDVAPAAVIEEPVADTMATKSVYLGTDSVLVYQCHVRKKYVTIKFSSSSGPTTIRVALKYYNEDTGGWVGMGTRDLKLTESTQYTLPTNAKYKLYAQKPTDETAGNVTLTIEGIASS